jgi:hypothetical protein
MKIAYIHTTTCYNFQFNAPQLKKRKHEILAFLELEDEERKKIQNLEKAENTTTTTTTLLPGLRTSLPLFFSDALSILIDELSTSIAIAKETEISKKD